MTVDQFFNQANVWLRRIGGLLVSLLAVLISLKYLGIGGDLFKFLPVPSLGAQEAGVLVAGLAYATR